MLCPIFASAQSAPDATASPAAAAGGDAAAISPEELAKIQEAIIKASQNPVGNIAIIPFQNNWNNGAGPNSQGQFNLNLQPVVPIMLNPNLNLIARAIMPIVNTPSPFLAPACASTAFGCGYTFGIGDLTNQFFFAPKTKPDALIWGVGPQFIFPTGTPATLTSGKYSAGPAAVALVMPGPWVIGALVTQAWSFSGDPTKPAVNSGLVQPFINYNIKGGWAISTAPIITANWNVAPNQRWTVPVGGGFSKTFKFADQPMQIGLFYYSNIVRPDAAPVNQFRLNYAILFPIKRGFVLP